MCRDLTLLCWCFNVCNNSASLTEGICLPFLFLGQDSGFPCFKGGPRTIQNLRKRCHLSLTEEVKSWSASIWTRFDCYCNHDTVCFFLAAMCVIGALSDQQQLRCMADTAVWLLSKGFKWNIVRLGLFGDCLLSSLWPSQSLQWSVLIRAVWKIKSFNGNWFTALWFWQLSRILWQFVTCFRLVWGNCNCIGRNTFEKSCRLHLLQHGFLFFIIPPCHLSELCWLLGEFSYTAREILHFLPIFR